MRRLQLDDMIQTWSQIAKEGFCTMHSNLSSWVQTRAGAQDNNTYKHFLGLKTMANMLGTPGCDELMAQHHDAGADAKMACLIYATVLRVAAPDREASSQATTAEPSDHVAEAMEV